GPPVGAAGPGPVGRHQFPYLAGAGRASESTPRSSVGIFFAPSWAHAPSLWRPRVSRSVTGTRRASSAATKSRVAAGVEAVHREPGVGFSGIRVTCPSRPASRDASASPRQGWLLTPAIIAYSTETRRWVAAAYSQAAASTSA